MSGTERIGITTTLPIEVILAARAVPVDLNNLFIGSKDPANAVFCAEKFGYPATSCAWIKGIYSAVRENDIQRVIGVVGGDCSNTLALMETLSANGIEVIPFAFPYHPDKAAINSEIDKLCNYLDVGRDSAEKQYSVLKPLRAKLAQIDTLTYSNGNISGWDNFEILLSSSDFDGGDIPAFEARVDTLLRSISGNKDNSNRIRLGLVGVPPIFAHQLFDTVYELGGEFVFSEVPLQFAMTLGKPDLTSAYIAYTYPYGIRKRIVDIKQEIKTRQLDGIVHYVQSFCHRAIEDIILKQELDIPVLTIEGDRPDKISAQLQLRIEIYFEVLTQLMDKTRIKRGEISV